MRVLIIYTCKDCGKTGINKKKKPPERCLKCYRIYHEMKEPPICNVCSKPLNRQILKKTGMMCRFCFVKSTSTIFKKYDNDDNFGNWLSGFVDGEGNFQFHKDGRGGFVFRIILREDDKPILEKIREYLGCGKLYYRDIKKNIHNWKKKYQSKKMSNQWTYQVRSVYDLMIRVIPNFDTYKLRAKKSKQYLTWRKKLLSTNFYKLLKEREEVVGA